MGRHSFKLSTISRALRAAQSVGAPIDRVEIDTAGSVVLHMAKPVEVAVPARDQHTAAPKRTST
jgi:hypothetical protein